MRGLNIYKRSQGKYTRITTFVAAMILVAWGCQALTEKLYYLDSAYWRVGIPLVIFALVAFVMFMVVNRPKTADFFIATEGEMKKVSWSSKKEIIGSTKVVIVTTFLMAGLLFLVDFIFANLFQKLLGT